MPADIGVFMIGVAFALDLINILVEYITFGIGGIIMDLLSAAIFTLWLGNYNIKLWGNKNASLTLLATFVDLIPFGDLTFPWTVRVGYAVFTEKKEVPKEAKVTASWMRL